MSIEHVADQAADAFASWSSSDGAQRSDLLTALAARLRANRDSLVVLADHETHLGQARLQGELDRTAFQLEAFATWCRVGGPFAHEDIPALTAPPPEGRPRILRVQVPLGPVAVFSASNFPFAFSVLGGDTASALAAGCSVIVKVHPLHAGLSRVVHQIASKTLRDMDLPGGLLGHVDGEGHVAGEELVRASAIQAVAFTGSQRGGLALERLCQARTPPIPFFGELGSVNPVLALSPALPDGDEADVLARQLAASVCVGAGQFCTSPGLLVLGPGAAAQRLVDTLAEVLASTRTHSMLGPGLLQAYLQGTHTAMRQTGVRVLGGCDGRENRPFLAELNVADFLAQPLLHEEIFGAALLIVRCPSDEYMVPLLQALPGSLTVTVWGAQEESVLARRLARAATQKGGRVLFAGVPTGVAVVANQHHGGPWPATNRPDATAVGLRAANRFLRPVAIQDPPPWFVTRQGRPL